MTPVEIAHRALRALQARAERSGLAARAAPCRGAGPRRRGAKPWVHADAGVDAAPYVAAAERIAAGPARRLRAARRRPRRAAALEPRSEDRHRGAARLRQAARLPRPRPGRRHQVPVGAEPPPAPRDAGAGLRAHAASASYLDALAEQLDSWFLACPYGRGPNWSSALEAALRLVNWSIAWQLVGGRSLEDASVPRRAG